MSCHAEVVVRVVLVIRCTKCQRKLAEIPYGSQRPAIKCGRCKTIN